MTLLIGDEVFRREYGLYLGNVRPGLLPDQGRPGTCRICAGPISGDYVTCHQCADVQSVVDHDDRPFPLDFLAFVTYAVEGAGLASRSEVSQVKDEGRHAYFVLFDPKRFICELAPGGVPVLLIGDSWTSGANLLSAGAALKTAGASGINVMALGRLLNPEAWLPTREFIDHDGLRFDFGDGLRLGFDPVRSLGRKLVDRSIVSARLTWPAPGKVNGQRPTRPGRTASRMVARPDAWTWAFCVGVAGNVAYHLATIDGVI